MRKELSDYLNKRVKCEGDIISTRVEKVPKSKRYPKGVCGRVTIRNVYVHGMYFSHINVRMAVKKIKTMEEKEGCHVEFTGLVYKYVKNVRDRKGRLTGVYREDYGIQDIKSVHVLSEEVNDNE